MTWRAIAAGRYRVEKLARVARQANINLPPPASTAVGESDEGGGGRGGAWQILLATSEDAI
jgi:hypothetical protein